MRTTEPETDEQRYWHTIGYNKGLLEILEKWALEREGWQKEIEPEARKLAAKLGMEAVMFGPKEKSDE